jgi:hypothetical protein
MFARWRTLHLSFDREIRTPLALHAFNTARRRREELAPFPEPAALVAFLTGSDGSPADKNRILVALVEMVQQHEAPVLASSLLWLALWPGLDRRFRLLRRYFTGTQDELVSAITTAFTVLVAGLNLGRVRHVAGTLLRSTMREVITEARRTSKALVPADGGVHLHRAEVDLPALEDSVLGVGLILPFEEQMAQLLGRLRPILGMDAELVLYVVVLDETQREAGTRLGLSHEAARKRFQRALTRVREWLEQLLSQSSLPGCISQGGRA